MSLEEGTRLQILAPVIRGRKGEYKSVFQDLGRSGFVRARVDGKIYELTDDIPMDRYKQHTIEVIIDRLILKKGIERRLADSIETALKMGKGLMTITKQLAGQEEMTEATFSEHFACRVCGFSMPELEPRLFSFNSPYGACPDCTGLGVKVEFDPELICPDPTKSIRSEAILPFLYKSGESKGWWPYILDAVGKAAGFDASCSFAEVSEKAKDIIWNGFAEPIKVVIKNDGPRQSYETIWEGILKVLQKRYESTESDWVRNNLTQYMSTKTCPTCQGKRLKVEALFVRVGGLSIADLTHQSVESVLDFLHHYHSVLTPNQATIGLRLINEILARLTFLKNVGLGYLTLDRTAKTLAGGEAQRIRLASQVGSGLMGCLYILDEPSIGLHQRDNQKLIETLERLRNLGNTVIVVEHDEETMHAADWLIELGPGAGEHGGEVVAQGPLDQFLKSDCLTARYLKGETSIQVPENRRKRGDRYIGLYQASGHNLKNIDVEIPLGLFVCITGVSGSGKSTLLQDTLYPRLMQEIYHTKQVFEPHKKITGLESLDKVINMDQSPIGRTPRSNPATYTGVFDRIRELFAMTPDAKSRGYKLGRFSFNVKGGRCEACKGDGILKIEMHFLPDVYVPCEVCKGKRYNRETLEVKYKGKTIADVLEMTIDEASDLFKPIPYIARKLGTLQSVGLGYIKMGQSATTLSGGEAQRVKLSAELSKRATGSTLYLLDEPTTGLHFEDVKKLLHVLHKLVDQGNTVLVIEHNLDVIKTADWLIDMGPDAGVNGGQVVGAGTPEDIIQIPSSHTGRFLKSVLEKQ